MDAIGDLSDIVEQYNSGDLDGSQLSRELVGWFKSSLTSIMAALGMEGEEGGGEGAWHESHSMEEEDASDRFARFEEMLAAEGGPGSGPHPDTMPDSGDDIGTDMIDEPMPDDMGGAGGIDPDTMGALRDIIQRLEDLVGDVDPEGDIPDDDEDLDDSDEDEDEGEAPPPKKPPSKKKKEK